MELNDKLDAFYQSVIEVAKQKSDERLSVYGKEYDQKRKEFKKNKISEMEALYHIEESKLTKELNRNITNEMMEYKQKLRISQNSLKDELFTRVEEKLHAFLKTEDYEAFLVQKINKAKKFAGKNEIIIYLNQTDMHLKEKLEQKTGCALTISDINFMGGIRGVIRSKNILIDESFSTKLNQEKKDYVYTFQ